LCGLDLDAFADRNWICQKLTNRCNKRPLDEKPSRTSNLRGFRGSRSHLRSFAFSPSSMKSQVTRSIFKFPLHRQSQCCFGGTLSSTHRKVRTSFPLPRRDLSRVPDVRYSIIEKRPPIALQISLSSASSETGKQGRNFR
jgi:hypothetical protein